MFSLKASRSGPPSRSHTPLQTLQPPTRPSSTAPPTIATVSAPAHCTSVRNTFYDPSPVSRRNTPTPVPISRRSPSPSPTSSPASHAVDRDGDDSEDGDGSAARDHLTPLPPIPHLAPLPNFAAPPTHLDLASSGRIPGTPFPTPGFGYGATGNTPDGPGVRAFSLPPPPRGLHTSGAAASGTRLFSFGRRVSGAGAGALGSVADTSGTSTFGSISPAHNHNHNLYTQNHTHGHFQQQYHAHHVPSPSVERYIPPFDDSFEASFDLAPPFEIARLRDSAHVRGKDIAGAGTEGAGGGSDGATNGGGGGANGGAQYYHPNESTFSISVSSATRGKRWWNCFNELFGWWPKAEDGYGHAGAAPATF